MSDGDECPDRRSTTIDGIIRKRKLADDLKKDHDYRGQLCRGHLRIPYTVGVYIEVLHIRPPFPNALRNDSRAPDFRSR
jgi:hypothetical protein